MEQPVFLKIYHSGKLITNRQFLSDQISIGSSTDGPSLTLADPSVCFWHALIEKRGGKYHISDLGSPNGTFVNTQPVLESALQHGDQIKVGDFVIQFFIGVPFVRPKVSGPSGKPVQNAQPVQNERATASPDKVSPVAAPEPVSTPAPHPTQGSGDSSSDSKVPGDKKLEEPAGEENPIPLFSSAPKEEKTKAPVSLVQQEGAVTSVSPEVPDVSPVDKGKRAPEMSSVSPGKESAPVFFPNTSGSTAPILQKMEENRPEPILHPNPIKKAEKKEEKKIEPVPSDSSLVSKASPISSLTAAKKSSLPEGSPVVSPALPHETTDKTTKPLPDDSPKAPVAKTTPVVETPTPVVAKEAPVAKTTPVVETPTPVVETPTPVVAKEAPVADTPPPVAETVEQNLKPLSRGTYAPESEIQDLDRFLAPGNGPVVEITVAWKERVLSVHHFEDSQKEITFGSDPKADIHCPNLQGEPLYTLLDIKQTPSVFISEGIKPSVLDHKGHHSFDKLVKQGLITTYGSRQVLPLSQGQLIRLDFSSSLRVYIRYTNRVQKAITAGLFNFNFSEMMGLMMSFFFMSMLVFYVALFSPQSLDPMDNLEEAGIKKATIEFKQKKRVVKLKMANKAQKRKTKLSIPNKSKKPKKTKRVGIKKAGKRGRLGQVASKPKAKSKKKTVTSARPGGSVRTKKSGAGAKSPRPDPTKVGLLGVFGKKGMQKALDKTYSGTGELAGLADVATGYAGQKETHAGEGIGTKFKNAGAGGKGTNLIGVSSGIKTKGRGGGARGYGRGGSLGQRGMVQLALGTSDWDVAGGVDKNAILRVIRRNKHQLEWCYEFSLQKRPDMEGKVLLKWDILNERVRNVRVQSNTTGDSALARCLMSRLKNFRFTGTGLRKGQVGEVRIPFAVTKG